MGDEGTPDALSVADVNIGEPLGGDDAAPTEHVGDEGAPDALSVLDVKLLVAGGANALFSILGGSRKLVRTARNMFVIWI